MNLPTRLQKFILIATAHLNDYADTFHVSNDINLYYIVNMTAQLITPPVSSPVHLQLA